MNRLKEEPEDLPDLQPFTQLDKLLQSIKPRSKPSHYVGQRLAKDFMSPFTGRVVATPSSSNEYYKIYYDEDGDKEELEEKDVEEGFKQYWENEGLQIVPSPKKKRKCRKLPGPKFPKGTLISREFPRTFGATIKKVPKKATGLFTIQYDVEKLKGRTVKVKKKQIEEMVAKYKLWIDFKIKRDKNDAKGRKSCNRPLKLE